jgi:hypothetical protein
MVDIGFWLGFNHRSAIAVSESAVAGFRSRTMGY